MEEVKEELLAAVVVEEKVPDAAPILAATVEVTNPEVRCAPETSKSNLIL